MSKNYNKFYKPHKEEQIDEPIQEKVEEVQTTEETVETPQEEAPVEEQEVEKPIVIEAVVTGAKRVNVRKTPSADKNDNIVTVLNEGDEVVVVPYKVTEPVAYGWTKVSIPSANIEEAYMMSQYLKEI